MKKKRNKLHQLLHFTVLIVGMYVLLWNCQHIDSLEKTSETYAQGQDKNIETVAIGEALDFLSTKKQTSSVASKGSSDKYLIPDFNKIYQKEINFSDEKLTVIPVESDYEQIKREILILKINDSIHAVVIHTLQLAPYKNYIHRKTLITDLDGNPIDCYLEKGGGSYRYILDKNSATNTVYGKSAPSDMSFDNGDDSDSGGGGFIMYGPEVTVVASQRTAFEAVLVIGTGEGIKTSDASDDAADNHEYDNYKNEGGNSNTPNYSYSEACQEGYFRNSYTGECEKILYCLEDNRVMNADGECIPVEEDDRIITDSLTGKAKCVYEQMLNGNNNLNWILDNFNDGDTPSQFDLKFEMSTELGDKTNASTATPIQSNIPNTFVIKINANRVETNTVLTVARTILHEGIHARLWEFVYRNDGKVDKNDFPGVYDYYMRYNNWQHQQMAAHYRETIAAGLKQFDNGQHNDSYYDALAWEGLSEIKDVFNNNERIDTEAWKALSTTEQEQILQIITNEKTNGDQDCE